MAVDIWGVVSIRLVTAMFTKGYGGKGSRCGYGVAVGNGPSCANDSPLDSVLAVVLLDRR